MRRQRNMAQIKEQNKTPEEELSNLQDAEFKALIISILMNLVRTSTS